MELQKLESNMKINKHVIIAGASRCGKTTLSLRLSKLGFVHYKMDSIKRGIDNNFWDHYHDDWKVVSPHMCHLIKMIIEENQLDIVRDKEYYCIDTCHIYPNDIAECNLKNTIIIFLGYTDLNIDEKIRDIRKYDDKTWSDKLTDEEFKPYLEEGIKYSREAKEMCCKYNIKYFDVSKNFNKVIEEAYQFIINELKKNG